MDKVSKRLSAVIGGVVIGGVVIFVVVPAVLNIQDILADICKNLAKTWVDYC